MKSGREESRKRLGRGLNALIKGVEEETKVSEKDLGERADNVVGDKLAGDLVISDQVISDQEESEVRAMNDVTGEKVLPVTSLRDKLSVISGSVISGQLSEDIIEKAVKEGKNNPRVVVWSPISSVVFRILKKTIPEFSVSKEAALLLEEAVKKKYPEIWKIAVEKLKS